MYVIKSAPETRCKQGSKQWKIALVCILLEILKYVLVRTSNVLPEPRVKFTQHKGIDLTVLLSKVNTSAYENLE